MNSKQLRFYGVRPNLCTYLEFQIDDDSKEKYSLGWADTDLKFFLTNSLICLFISGSVILFKGTVLGPAEIGLLATVGATRVEVHFLIFSKKRDIIVTNFVHKNHL